MRGLVIFAHFTTVFIDRPTESVHLRQPLSSAVNFSFKMVNDLPAGLPKWLDKFYFNDILRKDYGQSKIVRFNVAPANGKGENYASLMYRVKLTVETKEAGITHPNFIVKVNHAGMAQEMMALFNVFPKEIEMYVDYLPKFEQLYKDVGETIRFGPR